MSEPAAFPPARHLTRDLAVRIRRDASGSTLTLPIVPALRDGSGRVRTGVVAMIADIISGEAAVREALPGWIATLGLSLQVGDLPGEGHLAARARKIRKGRTTLVFEVDLEHVETGCAVGLSTLTFSLLPARTELQSRATWAEEPDPETDFANEDSGFEAPLLDTIGLTFDPDDPAIARALKTDYVGNTLGAMTGGVVAILAEAAADHFAAAELGGATRVHSLEIHFLRLAKVGPIRAEARTIGRMGSAIVVRVELRDEGQNGTLTTLASVVVDRMDD
ncbi:MAG: hypothetical protein NXI30_03360 [bacterium]|nr:hypothetical protein [bacterium]